MKGKIRIGHVAKYFGISKQTLIYYDQIDLLKPSYSEDNLYRYYTYDDTDKLELILMLKDSGLDLKSIKGYLSSPSHASGLQLLNQQKEELKIKLHQIEKTIKVLDNRIDYMSYYQEIEHYEDIQIIKKPMRTMFKVDIDHTQREPYDAAMLQLKILLDDHPSLYGAVYSKFCVIKSIESVLFEEAHYLSVFDFVTEEISDEHMTVLPSQNYICCHHHGPFYTSYITYKKMFEYMKKHDLEPDGNAIEVPLVDVWAAKSELDYITEIQIPVKQKR
ncbi:MAG: MerR family transcriptional regulator [Clostridiales bacterium]|nr:MerR family transcriptional regulator [Clostridiales bacterium]